MTTAPSGSLTRLGRAWQAVRPADRIGLAVFLGALLLYLPFAGTYGLWDPWETHYGEVARQMTKRGDFISLWWPGSPRETATFQTKPVLSFWLMSLGMQVAGIGSAGGPPHEMALGTRAEWAMRTPFCLMGALGLWAVYLVTARLAGRRAGVFAAIVTGTFPMYALVARQAMTDMAFVGLMTLALALAALAFERILGTRDPGATPGSSPQTAQPSDRLRGWFPESLAAHGAQQQEASTALRGWFSRLRGWFLIGGTPEAASLGTARGFSIALFLVATVPQLLVDSIDLRVTVPWGDRNLTMYGIVAMAPYWLGAAGVVVYLLRTKKPHLHALAAAATLAGLAVLAKGLAGLALPVVMITAYVAVRSLGTHGLARRLKDRELWFALGVCLIIAAVVAVPWHHSMYIRHGAPWWNELFGDNHWRRLMIGRHGDRGTFTYFLRQLGYGAWPYVAVAVAAFATAVVRPPRDERRKAALTLGMVWFVTAYVVVSLSMTKFHHYLLPALPGLGIVIGCFFDDLWSRTRVERTNAAAPSPDLPARWLVGTAAVIGLPALAAITFDLGAAKDAAERFLWLFSYDYVYTPAGRPWPPELEFRPAIFVLGAAFTLATLLIAFRLTRRFALWALPITAILCTLFLLDVFMPKVAAHWSQKPVIARYYRERRSPDERLIAYYLFWRGETFYTKNAIYEGPEAERTLFDHWPDADARLKTWIENHRGNRHYFLFQPSREARLRALLPPEAQASLRIIDRSHNLFVLGVADL